MSDVINIRFKPSVKQWRAYEHLMDYQTTDIGYGGAAFSGKSYLMCYWLTIMCNSYPGTAWGLGRKELTTLKKTTLVTLMKVFAECNIKPGRDYNYNQQLNFIRFTNGSIIYLIDTARQPSDPLYTRFGGFELTGAAIDESAETDEYAIEILSTRLGRCNNEKYGLKAKMLETFNPAKNHVYRKYYKPHKDGTMKPGVAFVPALPKDNPSPEVPAYIERILRTGSQVTIERLINGNFEYDDDPATLIDHDSITDYFVTKADFDKGWHLKPDGLKYITIDVARKGKDKTVLRVWHGWVCIHREEMAKSLTTEVVDRARVLMQRYGVAVSNVIADEDGVGGGVVDGLRCKGFINNSKPAEIKDGHEYVVPNFDNLKAQCSIMMAKKIVAREVGEICDNTEVRDATAQEMEQVKMKDVDKDGKQGIVSKERVSELINRSPDDWDSIMMRYYFELHKPYMPDIR